MLLVARLSTVLCVPDGICVGGDAFAHTQAQVRDYSRVDLNQLFTNFIWGAYIVRGRQGKRASVHSPRKVPQA